MQQRPLSTPPESIRPGATVIAGKYRIEGMLGAGAMGTVWTATHVNLGSKVAVKLVSADFARSDETRSRFLAEAKAAATLRSRYVVQMYDSGVTDDGAPYIVMEYLNGESLEERIARIGRLPLDQVVKIIGQVAKGLQRAHKHNIVHRDLKPANIFLATNEDGEEVAKILDFGIAKMEHEDKDYKATATGVIMGTPLFMSPEQARGLKSVNATSDLYSLGMVAYAALVGDVPFHSESFGDLVYMVCTKDLPPLGEVAPWLPATMDGWFRCACHKEQTMRFANAELMYQSLTVAAQLSRPGPNPLALSDSLSSHGAPDFLGASGSGAFTGASRLSGEVTGALTLPFSDSESGRALLVEPYRDPAQQTQSTRDALSSGTQGSGALSFGEQGAGTESGTRARPGFAHHSSTHDGVLAADVTATRLPKHGLRLPALLGGLAALAVAAVIAALWLGDDSAPEPTAGTTSASHAAAAPSAVGLSASPKVTPMPSTEAADTAERSATDDGNADDTAKTASATTTKIEGKAATNKTASASGKVAGKATASGHVSAASVEGSAPKPEVKPRPKYRPPKQKTSTKSGSATKSKSGGVDLGF